MCRSRNNRLGPLARVAAPNAAHVQRGPNPLAFHGRIPLLPAVQPVEADRRRKSPLVERSRIDGRPLRRVELPHAVVKPRNRDPSRRLVGQRADQLAECVHRIDHRPAVQSRMEVPVGPRRFDFDEGQPPQTARDGRRLPPQQRRVRDQNDIRRQHLFVLSAPGGQGSRSDLLFALEHELDVAPQRPGRHQRLERFDVHESLPLVVVRSASPDPAVADHRFERFGRPLVDRIHRHHVVMPVDQHRRCLRRDDPFAVDDRIAVRSENLGPRGSGPPQRLAQPLRTAHHIRPMRRLGADRRNAQVVEKFVEKLLFVLFDISRDRKFHPVLC